MNPTVERHAPRIPHGRRGRGRVVGFVLAVLLGGTVPASAVAQCIDYQTYLHHEASLFLPDDPNDLAVVGDLAYVVAGGGSGLRIYDLADLSQPVLLGDLPMADAAAGVTVAGDLACVVADSALIVVDVADPSLPVEIGRLGLSGRAADLALYGDYAYVADGYLGVDVCDLTTPSSPASAGHLALPGLTRFVAIAGHYLYVVADRLYVYDLVQPASPVVKHASSTITSVFGMVAWGDALYVNFQFSGFAAVDLAVPTNPTVAANVLLPFVGGPIACAGDRAYVVAVNASRLAVIDIADPLAPALLGLMDTMRFPRNVCALGDVAGMCQYGGLVQFVDATHPRRPLPSGGLALDWFPDTVEIHGGHAYISKANDILEIVDIADPSQPELVNSLTLAFPGGIAFTGDFALVAQSGGELQVLDIGTPAAAHVVGGTVLPEDQRGIAVVAEGTRACMIYNDIVGGTNTVASGLRVVDISVPTAPALMGDVQWTIGAANACMAGQYVYVAGGHDPDSFRTIDISDPSAPVVVSSIDLDAHDVAVAGGFAYVGGADGLLVFDLAVPEAPVLVGSAMVPGGPQVGIAVSGHLAYLASYEAGLQVVDISDPTRPWLAGQAPTEMDEARAVAVSGDGVFVVDRRWGLQVFPGQCQEGVPDCNGNGVADFDEITAHPSLDFNGDGILDSCQQGQDVAGVAPSAASVELDDAVPNPFNPVTSVGFRLERGTVVSLGIYDLSGRLVRTLIAAEFLPQGRHVATWDGRDGAARRVASGVYLYRLDAGGHRVTKRVMLVK